MKQKELFPDIETITCPVCGNTADVDAYDCCGLPDGILQCNAIINEKDRSVRCWCFIDTRTMKEWDGTGDSEFEEQE